MKMKKLSKTTLILILSLLAISKAAPVDRTVTRSEEGIRIGEFKTSEATFLSYAAYAKDRYTKKLAYTDNSSRDHLYNTSRYSYRARRVYADRNGVYVNRLGGENSKKWYAYSADSQSNNYYAFSEAEPINVIASEISYTAVSCDLACMTCVDKVCT